MIQFYSIVTNRYRNIKIYRINKALQFCRRIYHSKMRADHTLLDVENTRAVSLEAIIGRETQHIETDFRPVLPFACSVAIRLLAPVCTSLLARGAPVVEITQKLMLVRNRRQDGSEGRCEVCRWLLLGFTSHDRPAVVLRRRRRARPTRRRRRLRLMRRRRRCGGAAGRWRVRVRWNQHRSVGLLLLLLLANRELHKWIEKYLHLSLALAASKAICFSKSTTNLARKLVDVVILPLTVWVFVILFHFFGLLTPVCANLLCVGIVVIHAACAS